MKIAFISTSAPRFSDDNRSPFILEQAKKLIDAGCDLDIITIHHPGLKLSEIIEGVQFVRVRYGNDKFETLSVTRAGIPDAWRANPLKSLVQLTNLGWKLICHLKAHGYKYDIVHANWTFAGLAAILSRRRHRKPIVLTVHGTDIAVAKRYFLIRIITRWILNEVDWVTAVSSYLADEIRSLGVKTPHISVIPNGTDVQTCQRLDTDIGDNRILFVGSLTTQKRPVDLVKALPSIISSYPDVSAYFIGEGPESGKILHMANSLGVLPSVHLIGPLKHSNVIKHMRKASLFVLPSLNEGFGIVLIEAMACGTPCIAYDSGGVQDILGDGTGYLVEPGNVPELAASIKFLLSNKVSYLQHRRKGYIKISSFRWNIVTTQLIELYNDLSRHERRSPK